ncbi:MAG: hypothetical protein ISR58_09535 [Anaerolineales bacterium]|nr:hypothetical protein [Anaerolineales bacterium]
MVYFINPERCLDVSQLSTIDSEFNAKTPTISMEFTQEYLQSDKATVDSDATEHAAVLPTSAVTTTPSPTSTPTNSPAFTLTASLTATLTSTITPTAILTLPVSEGTSIPLNTRELTIENSEQITQLARWLLDDEIIDISWASKQNLLAVLTGSNKCILLNTLFGERTLELDRGESNSQSVALSHDGTLLAIGGSEGIDIIQAENGEQVFEIKDFPEYPFSDYWAANDIAFSPSTNTLAVVNPEWGFFMGYFRGRMAP